MSEAPQLTLTALSPEPELQVTRRRPVPTILSPDGEESIPLEAWCELEGIAPSNARGYYIPKGQIPKAFKVGSDWWVPRSSVLIRRGHWTSKKR